MYAKLSKIKKLFPSATVETLFGVGKPRDDDPNPDYIDAIFLDSGSAQQAVELAGGEYHAEKYGYVVSWLFQPEA